MNKKIIRLFARPALRKVLATLLIGGLAIVGVKEFDPVLASAIVAVVIEVASAL